MEWKLFADLAEVAGEDTVEIDAAIDTVDDALAALLERHPGLEERILDEDGELLDHINVLCNGESVRNGDGMDTQLEDGDELALFPPVSGGEQ
ncbi:Molybdopterin converting factor, small subunit [Halalkaliarchaeum sp. AArc-CO]|uniref:ubiquitin-like small modifier protein 1 n=1 Tax=unclassified Halalkaliarchaeum TaxID=2678344 RepID=UPI00217DD8D9|nr:MULTISPECIES: ubiquitin-like small modifier protein 1 [unclassified Halalkaliarchaeum]MDR5674734.1 ubiquitin-like small modifier protein 1 [Halalkaliarchaeum sp. AArc-GB]UWG51031.1 Molybdopterin converting factor, small subunit [Halalkaliarchaeum sp. AArc-CO]